MSAISEVLRKDLLEPREYVEPAEDHQQDDPRYQRDHPWPPGPVADVVAVLEQPGLAGAVAAAAVHARARVQGAVVAVHPAAQANDLLVALQHARELSGGCGAWRGGWLLDPPGPRLCRPGLRAWRRSRRASCRRADRRPDLAGRVTGTDRTAALSRIEPGLARAGGARHRLRAVAGGVLTAGVRVAAGGRVVAAGSVATHGIVARRRVLARAVVPVGGLVAVGGLLPGGGLVPARCRVAPGLRVAGGRRVGIGRLLVAAGRIPGGVRVATWVSLIPRIAAVPRIV